MANMSYCRFRNTRLDVQDCLEVLQEEKPLSRDEASAGRWMLDEILIFCRDEGIIDNYDGEALRDAFIRRTEKAGEDDEW